MAQVLSSHHLAAHCKFGVHKLIHTTACLKGYQLGNNLQDCYSVLRVNKDSDDNEVREAYLDLAKQYHPDSGSLVADHRKFAQVDEAYRSIMNERSRAREAAKAEEKLKAMEEDFGIRHTGPQHRQYLSYEGIGFGTPSRRERQYQKYKVQRASDNVTEYRISKVVSQYETALVTKDKIATRKRTITRKYSVANTQEDRDVYQEMSIKDKDSNAIERLVEDLIQESMAKGDFNDLPGKGKPVDYTVHNPMVDTPTHNLNKVLINNGYVPEWVLKEKEIRGTVEKGKDKLWKARVEAGAEPLVPFYSQRIEDEIKLFKETVVEANRSIDTYNLTVPSMRLQRMHFSADKIIQELFKEYKQKLESGEIERVTKIEPENIPVDTPVKVDLKQLWREIRGVFSSS